LKIFEYDLIVDGIVVGQRTSAEGRGPIKGFQAI
jgi:hypothetical protein